MSDTSTSGSPFWRFSLAFYRRPNVGEACIQLQEQSGVDVNLLLFLLWQASRSRTLTAAEIAALDGKLASWRDMTVIPLRAIRRALKSPPALVDANAAEAFRNRIKAVELDAERLQQEAMYAQAEALGRNAASPTHAARGNIAAYATVRAAVFAKPAVETLLAAFATIEPKGD
jgi:uncharacterized protein (TIGR02444 family)